MNKKNNLNYTGGAILMIACFVFSWYHFGLLPINGNSQVGGASSARLAMTETYPNNETEPIQNDEESEVLPPTPNPEKVVALETPTTAPSAPTYVSAKGVAADQINLIWNIPSSLPETVTKYYVYKDGNNITPIATVNAQLYQPIYADTGVNKYQDIGVSPNSTHTYYVVASDGTNNSLPSVTVSATAKSGTGALIPPERLTSWIPGVTVGVPGGIDSKNSVRTNIVNVVTDPRYRVDNTGQNDVSVKISQAIAEAPDNSIIYLPQGTYLLPDAHYIYIGRSNITLRGDGPNLTKIHCYGHSPSCIDMYSGYNSNPGVSILSGVAKGSSQITVSNASEYNVGDLAYIQVVNDLDIPIISTSGYPNVRFQGVIIEGKSGNTINFTPQIAAELSPAGAILSSPVGPGFLQKFNGIEDLTVEAFRTDLADVETAPSQGISINGYGQWVKNVVVKNPAHRALVMGGVNLEVRHSTFNFSGQAGTANHAGILTGALTGALVEDNVIGNDTYPSDIEVDSSTVASVFAYNVVNFIDTNHAPHNSHNLYEGNITGAFESDGYYGSESEATFFRNNGGFFILKRMSRNMTIVGNVGVGYSFGQPNIGNAATDGDIAQPSQGIYWKDWNPTTGPTVKGRVVSVTDSQITLHLDSHDDAVRYARGPGLECPALNCSYWPVLIDWGNGRDPNKFAAVHLISMNLSTDTIVADTLYYNAQLRTIGSTPIGLWPRAEGFQELDLDVNLTTIQKGNYVSGVSGIPENESLNGQTLPNSLYHSSKPNWFGNLNWPAFSPTNPNRSNDLIPAGYRLSHNGDDPPGVGGNGPFLLTVFKGGTGQGTVTGNGINCGSDCTESYNSGTSVTLTAAALSGSTFDGWGGCSTTSGNTCTVTMTNTRNVSATFNSTQVNPPPVVTLTATPSTITPGGSATLTWSSTNNATGCTGSGTGFVGSHGASGNAEVSPTQTTQYTLTCSNTGGPSQPATVTVTVSVQAPADADNDGIADSIDVCPLTPSGLTVNPVGCPRPKMSNFDIKPNVEGNLNSVSNVEIGKAGTGKVKFTPAVSLIKASNGGTLDINSNLRFSKGKITLDSVNMPELNKPATVTFYNLNLHPNSQYLRPGGICSGCQLVSYINKTLIFTVPGFSTYEVLEDESGGLGGGDDITAPVISSVRATSITKNKATIKWTTDESSDSQVEYGLTTSYGNTTSLSDTTNGVTSHTVNLSSLTGNTTYHYRVKSKDTSGNLTTSGDNTFKTKSSGGGGGGGGGGNNNPPPSPTSVPGCNPGDIFSSTTGQRCPTQTQTISGCSVGVIFSPITGQRCPTTITTTPPTYIPPSTPPTSSIYTRNLTGGSQGVDVTTLQRYLISKGYLGAGRDNGFFGYQTIYAVQALQRAAGIVPASGFFGVVTRNWVISH